MMKEESRDIHICESLAESLSNMVNKIDNIATIGVYPCENKDIGFAYIYLVSFSLAIDRSDIKNTIYDYCKKHGIELNSINNDFINMYFLVMQSEEDVYKLLAVLKLEGY